MKTQTTVPTLNFPAFAAKYCERQDCTPEKLRESLEYQKVRFAPKGWFMLECQMLDSSRCGEFVIVPFGGATNTFKEVPNHPVSPRGLASDMSIVVATMGVNDLPES